MIQFFDRDSELNYLEQKYESTNAEMLVFYGRRRIGKTALLEQFMNKKNCIYFLGRLESQVDTIERINQLFIEFFHDSHLAKYRMNNWDVVWEYLGQKAGSRLVIILDEFPFLVEKFPNLLSVLQDKWDSLLRHTHLMLILSGSSIAMMEKYALDYHSPLYGRRTGQWKVNPLPVTFLHSFYPVYCIEDLIKIYACLDMIPGYLVKFDPNESVDVNLRKKIFAKGEYLYEEVQILLREKFRDPSNYVSILAGIAGGLTSFGEIANHTHLEKSLLSKYLSTLELVQFIEKIQPILDPPKSTLRGKGLYRIKDHYLDFWFRFVFPNQATFERGLMPSLWTTPSPLHQYYSFKFEDFIQEILPYLDIAEFNQIGRWWYKQIEIDVCAFRDDPPLLFLGECKWSEQVSAIEIIKNLKPKTDEILWKQNSRVVIYGIFAKSFSKKITEFQNIRVICIDFSDLEKIMLLKH